MNYRHAFHAGNFADVVKHALLGRIVTHLQVKETPFRVIDTHAGSGLTDLTGDEARRGAEWPEGIGRLWRLALAPEIAGLLAPYLAAVATCNGDGPLRLYPGSPLLIRHWLRPQDRLIACELEPTAASALSRNLRGDARVKTVTIDGWTALNAYIPPKERRGLVLIDPPYEDGNELPRAVAAVNAAHRKWPGGIVALWYPIKDARANARAFARLDVTDPDKTLQIELSRADKTFTRLRGTGLLVVNPPWTLRDEAQILLPALARAFWPDERSEFLVAPPARR